MRGFFSKDLVLETFNYSRGGVLLVVLIFLNVALTYFYTYQLVVFIFQVSKSTPYTLRNEPKLASTIFVGLLATLRLTFGAGYLQFSLPAYLLAVPSALKFMPILLHLIVFGGLFINLKQLTPLHPSSYFVFGNILGLTGS